MASGPRALLRSFLYLEEGRGEERGDEDSDEGQEEHGDHLRSRRDRGEIEAKARRGRGEGEARAGRGRRSNEVRSRRGGWRRGWHAAGPACEGCPCRWRRPTRRGARAGRGAASGVGRCWRCLRGAPCGRARLRRHGAARHVPPGLCTGVTARGRRCQSVLRAGPGGERHGHVRRLPAAAPPPDARPTVPRHRGSAQAVPFFRPCGGGPWRRRGSCTRAATARRRPAGRRPPCRRCG